MGHAQISEQKYTVGEYLEMEEKSEIRHEFYDGEIFAMAGTTMNHNDIVDNVRSLLKKVFVPRGCRVFAENIKVEAVQNFFYPYPDVIVACAKEDINGTYIVRYPSILVEVLSKSSATYDQGFKLRMYKAIPSLEHYLLVSQNEFYVELYTRTEQKNIWMNQSFDQPSDIIKFDSLNFEITLSAIYENIVFVSDEEAL
ncbi:Uma2 family endonuclease [Dyadobacter chenwenxiniae]|uniref:Uma2 family endonuclease n=1 Tax=Dyadobacter chenwenxiniae TaxID=2906456 RepID=A0A9X1TH70_9BACT|nr:Uma2 family endonuclease [Dyadobacter chenwenxiniae]MCF0064224.1 Uma2 family endonuclease [Dyadobacter chenwenxiniae]UON82562.1 Uma2 family endonuclease [Dyadobacter chenwenxiniae]